MNDPKRTEADETIILAHWARQAAKRDRKRDTDGLVLKAERADWGRRLIEFAADAD